MGLSLTLPRPEEAIKQSDVAAHNISASVVPLPCHSLWIFPRISIKLVIAVSLACPPVLASASNPSTPAPASTCDLSLDLSTALLYIGGGVLKGSTSWYYVINSPIAVSMRCTDIVGSGQGLYNLQNCMYLHFAVVYVLRVLSANNCSTVVSSNLLPSLAC